MAWQDYDAGRKGQGYKDYSSADNLRGWNERDAQRDRINSDFARAVGSNPVGAFNALGGMFAGPVVLAWKVLTSKVGLAAIVIGGALYGYNAFQSARSPEAQRQHIEHDVSIAQSSLGSLRQAEQTIMVNQPAGATRIDALAAHLYSTTGYNQQSAETQAMCDYLLNAQAKAHPEWWTGSVPQIARDYKAELSQPRQPTAAERPPAMLAEIAKHTGDFTEASGKKSLLKEPSSMATVTRCLAVEKLPLKLSQ